MNENSRVHKAFEKFIYALCGLAITAMVLRLMLFMYGVGFKDRIL